MSNKPNRVTCHFCQQTMASDYVTYFDLTDYSERIVYRCDDCKEKSEMAVNVLIANERQYARNEVTK